MRGVAMACVCSLRVFARADPLQDLERKANDLVRLALFNEQKRVPLRRDEISKKGTLVCALFWLEKA